MSLYERLGASQRIKKIADDIVENHLNNQAITTRFKNMNMTRDELENGTAMFFVSGTGGPNEYKGQDMLTIHKGMNISAVEFMAILYQTD